MTERFQVSSRATGMRRTIDVWVYDTVEELRQAASCFSPHLTVDEAHGVCQTPTYRWPRPPGAWFGVIRYHRGQLDAATVVHEVTHAAMEIYFADCTDWNSRTRAHFRADNEPIAYLMGELVERVNNGFHRMGAIDREGSS